MKGKFLPVSFLVLIILPLFFALKIFSQTLPGTRDKVHIEKSVYEAVQSYIRSGVPLRANGTLDYRKITQYADSVRSAMESESTDAVSSPDLTLSYVSVIRGTVYESDGSTPIANAAVRVYNQSHQQAGWNQTNSQGSYSVGNLGEGSYYVKADGYVCGKGDHYYPQYYDMAASQGAASLVTVTGEDTVNGINFSLNRKGAISGRVTDEGGQPIANTMVTAYNASMDYYGGAQTDGNGHYIIYCLLTGSYTVHASGYIVGEGEFYLEEYYDNSPSEGGATPVSVNEPNTTTGIDFALTRGFHVWVQCNPAWAGYVEISPQKLVYAPGDVVTLEAVLGSYAGDNYRFHHWEGDADGTDNPTEIVMNSDKEVVAVFEEVSGTTFHLSVSSEPIDAGTVVVDPEQTEYDSGAVVHLTADAHSGWAFMEWSGHLSGSANPEEVVMCSDKLVTARFGHTLGVSIVPEGKGNVEKYPDLGVYSHNSHVQLFAQPLDGYVFASWGGDTTATEEILYLTMTTNKHVYAEFVPAEVTLEMQMYPEGSGIIAPEVGLHGFQIGEVVSITAYAQPGYCFVRWEGDVENPENYYTTVTMNESKVVKAVFEEDLVTLHMKVYPEGAGSTCPEVGLHSYQRGEVVEVRAEAAEGYRFVRWEGGVENPESLSTTVTMDESKIVKAKFEPLHVTLEMRVYPEGSGTTTPATGTHTYQIGEIVTISAHSAAGYKFLYWEGPVAQPTHATTTVTMSGNNVVKAKFQKICVTLQMLVYPEGSGRTTPPVGVHSYERGQVVTIVSEPEESYRFVRWEGEVVDSHANTTSVMMYENKIVKAIFEESKVVLEIRVVPSEGGTTEPPAGEYVHHPGDTVVVVAKPNDGFRFVGWEGVVTDLESDSITVVVNEYTLVKAKFEPVDLIITLQAHPEEGGTTEPPPGDHAVQFGDTVRIAAIPEAGYRFKQWVGPVADKDSERTTVVIEDCCTVKAVFTQQDEDPPTITQCFPRPGTRNVPKNTKIQIKGKDAGSGIDRSSLQLWVNGDKVVCDGQDQTGGQVTLVFYSCRFRLVYQPATDFEEGCGVEVTLSVGDQAEPPNTCDTTFSFSAGRPSIGYNNGNTVSQSGGQIANPDSNIIITVPAEALDDTVEITINPVDDLPELPEEFNGLPLGYHFGPDGLQFSEPVIVKLSYTPEMLHAAGVSSPYDLKIYYYHTTTGEWVELLIGSIDEDGSIIEVYVNQFCYFTLGVSSSTGIQSSTGDGQSPTGFKLFQNYPNPFNPETQIRYHIPEPSHVQICIFNSFGRQICTLVDSKISTGMHEVAWDARNDAGIPVSSGLYIVRMIVGRQVFERKMAFLK